MGAQPATLQAVFRRIGRERMEGLPFLNSALEVEAVGFRPWEAGSIGVLITPWFMNLMLLPGEADWRGLPVGAKRTHRFASGSYEFTVGEEEAIGRYQMCSLFSPVQQFTDHAAAVATAQAVMAGLMDSNNREELSLYERWERGSGSGPGLGEAAAAVVAPPQGPGMTESLARPISRRDLLRGRTGGR